jgi:molybdopterin converting factor subunit 1
MLLEVRLFAMLREAGGSERIQVHLEPGASVASLRTAIAREFPTLATHLSTTRVAANLQFVSDDHLLIEGQEIALIPPVSGG